MNTLDDYVQKLDSGERFGVARYGDGEWGAILGKVEKTIYGDVVTPQLTAAIKNTLLNPKSYYYASLGEPWSAEVNEWIRQNNVECQWAKKQVLEQASTDGKLLPFLQALRRRKVLVVGLERLMPFVCALGFNGLWLPMNCFGQTLADPFGREVANQGYEVILFACGMASVVFIHELWDKTNATLIDIGSLFDPYVGYESRRGHRRPEFRENVRKTLEALNGDKAVHEAQRLPEGVEGGREAVRESVGAGAESAEMENAGAA